MLTVQTTDNTIDYISLLFIITISIYYILLVICNQ